VIACELFQECFEIVAMVGDFFGVRTSGAEAPVGFGNLDVAAEAATHKTRTQKNRTND
jgi:hypothetical protein